MQQAKAGLEAVYLSGWQVAADGNTSETMYPDQSLYAYDSVPTMVRRINNTFKRADEIQWSRGIDPEEQGIHRLLPAHRGRCGSRFRRRAERLRTDEEHDHRRRRRRALRRPAGRREEVRPHGRQGAGADPGSRREADRRALRRRHHGRADHHPGPYRCRSRQPADLRPRRQRQALLTGERTPEGFYRVKNGLEQSISRGVAYAPYADLVWCETGVPDLGFAREFAQAVQAACPGKLLSYNCSPSFNWKKNLDDKTIAKFQDELSAMGYKYQFITLAGIHINWFQTFQFAHAYARGEGMKHYVDMVQEPEFAARDKGYTFVSHQQEVGVQGGYFDDVTTVIQGGPSSGLRQGADAPARPKKSSSTKPRRRDLPLAAGSPARTHRL
jgi:isocitrate lyase